MVDHAQAAQRAATPEVSSDHAGNPTAALEEKAAQLRLSEQRFRTLVEATSLVVWRLNASGEADADVPSWREFTGQSFERGLGFGWLEAVHPGDRARVQEEWLRAVASGQIFISEYRARRHDGEYRRLAVRGVPIKGPDGVVQEWIGTCEDVTRRKQAKRRLAALIDSVPGFVYRCLNDPDWTVESISGGVERLTGYPPSAFAGPGAKAYADLIVPEDRAPVWDAVQKAVATQTAYEIRYRVRTSAGELRWF